MNPGDPYNGMIPQAPQGQGQANYQRALTPQGQTPLASLSQGNPSYGAQGMPSNGQGPNMQQRIGQALQGIGGQRQGVPPGQAGQMNPFLAAIARLHAQRQQQAPQGLGAMMNPGMGAQWGPNPMPQGMRLPGTMPPQQPQQPVQWGQWPPQQGNGGR